MFESKTFETLLAQKLARVPKKLDKREGSIIYDALAPNAFETAMVYAAMDVVLDETFADTASRKYLVRRCAERGITPRPATVATAKGSFNIDVPIGSRFSCDKFNWIVTERIKAGSFYMECETAGSAPSQHIGALIPIEYIDGLTYGELTEIVVHGEDAEATEDLRSRYFASFTGQTYGFNRAQYIAVTKGIPGVGGCKPYRAWSGGGTVKLVITDSDYGVPSEELIERVQSVIDPTENHGDGIGLAPIDHVVTVAGVTKTRINVVTSVTFAEGYSLRLLLPPNQKSGDGLYVRAELSVGQSNKHYGSRVSDRTPDNVNTGSCRCGKHRTDNRGFKCSGRAIGEHRFG